ncbi:uncharacterized protein LOC142352063 isoform X1 [Convolutriloba macropyga]|uniref:uncharacterized protein LOC142352063 isoform X1 n=1 Tax=Convolutriloba macropyga TaxID=536237 RepID=UPI003F52661B
MSKKCSILTHRIWSAPKQSSLSQFSQQSIPFWQLCPSPYANPAVKKAPKMSPPNTSQNCPNFSSTTFALLFILAISFTLAPPTQSLPADSAEPNDEVRQMEMLVNQLFPRQRIRMPASPSPRFAPMMHRRAQIKDTPPMFTFDEADNNLEQKTLTDTFDPSNVYEVGNEVKRSPKRGSNYECVHVWKLPC